MFSSPEDPCKSCPTSRPVLLLNSHWTSVSTSKLAALLVTFNVFINVKFYKKMLFSPQMLEQISTHRLKPRPFCTFLLHLVVILWDKTISMRVNLSKSLKLDYLLSPITVYTKYDVYCWCSNSELCVELNQVKT